MPRTPAAAIATIAAVASGPRRALGRARGALPSGGRPGRAVVAAVTAIVAAVAVVSAGGWGPAQAETGEPCRSLPVDADGPLRAAEARARFGVDGSGVVVGIISNSFDVADDAVTDAADDVAAGALPGPGNPCSHTQPVRVLIEGAEGSDDEGRAMAQVVHGIAPAARLLFASADPDQSAAVDALVDAGADVIVDDIWTPAEPIYQQGPIGQAVQRAVDRGVVYVAAAGNLNVVGAEGYPSAGLPIGGWATAAFRPTGCPASVVAASAGPVDCLDVDPGPGTSPTNAVTLAPEAATPLVLHWGDPLGLLDGTHLDVWVLDDTGAVISTAPGIPGASTAFGALVNGGAEPARQHVVVARRLDVGQPRTPAVRWATASYGRSASLLDLEVHRSTGGDVVGATMGGHAAYGAAIPVAAADWRDPLVVEPFSSLGPVVQLFAPASPGAPPAPPLPDPFVVGGPSVTGVDRVRTTFFPLGDPSHQFTGTSAASPTVAGVLALAVQARPDARPDVLRAALEATARPMRDRYPASLVDPARVQGHGLVDAEALLAHLGAEPPPAPSPAPTAPPARSGPSSRLAVPEFTG